MVECSSCGRHLISSDSGAGSLGDEPRTVRLQAQCSSHKVTFQKPIILQNDATHHHFNVNSFMVSTMFKEL